MKCISRSLCDLNMQKPTYMQLWHPTCLARVHSRCPCHQQTSKCQTKSCVAFKIHVNSIKIIKNNEHRWKSMNTYESHITYMPDIYNIYENTCKFNTHNKKTVKTVEHRWKHMSIVQHICQIYGTYMKYFAVYLFRIFAVYLLYITDFTKKHLTNTTALLKFYAWESL